MKPNVLQRFRFLSFLILARWSFAQYVTVRPGYMGFTELSDNYYSEVRCDFTLAYTTFLSFADCVNTAGGRPIPSQVVTDCQNGVQTYGNGRRETCSTRSVYGQTTPAGWDTCRTSYIFDYSDDPTPSATQYACGRSTSVTTGSRIKTLPAGAIYETVDGTGPRTVLEGPTASITNSAFPDSTSTDSSSRRGRSKSWIAGVVVGPLVALAITIIGICACLRRRKNKKALSNPPAGPAYQGQNPALPDKNPTQMIQQPMSPPAPISYATGPNPISPPNSYTDPPPPSHLQFPPPQHHFPQGTHQLGPPNQGYVYYAVPYNMVNGSPANVPLQGNNNAVGTSPHQSQVYEGGAAPGAAVNELPERNTQPTAPQ